MFARANPRLARSALRSLHYRDPVRYESRAYGTREEIIAWIKESSLTPGRSERRMREGARAVVLLEEGEDYVWFAETLYVVETEEGAKAATEEKAARQQGT